MGFHFGISKNASSQVNPEATAFGRAWPSTSSHMKQQSLSTAAKISIAALVLLGMVVGSLIVAHGGFETSPKRGGASVFVPAPQGFFIAAMMYGMSVIGLVALLRASLRSTATVATAIALYVILAVAFVNVLGRI